MFIRLLFFSRLLVRIEAFLVWVSALAPIFILENSDFGYIIISVALML